MQAVLGGRMGYLSNLVCEKAVVFVITGNKKKFKGKIKEKQLQMKYKYVPNVPDLGSTVVCVHQEVVSLSLLFCTYYLSSLVMNIITLSISSDTNRTVVSSTVGKSVCTKPLKSL